MGENVELCAWCRGKRDEPQCRVLYYNVLFKREEACGHPLGTHDPHLMRHKFQPCTSSFHGEATHDREERDGRGMDEAVAGLDIAASIIRGLLEVKRG